MASIYTYTIINNDPNDTAVLNYINITTNLTQIQHHLQLSEWPDWQSPWNAAPYDDFTGSSTARAFNKTFVSVVTSVIKTYQGSASTGGNYYMKLNNNTDILNGYAVSGEDFTGPTVAATSGTAWVRLSEVPAPSIPLVVGSSSITFSPPEELLVLNNTTDLEAGWTALGTGYSGQTILSVQNGSTLVMSGPPSTTPFGTIVFTSNSDEMISIPPGASKVFSMDYNNVTTAIGTYTSAVSLNFTLGSSPVVKSITNIYTIGPAGDPFNPGFSWDLGGGGGGGGDCGTGGDGGSCGR
jgi:hypothetical protein